jgi:hypothetical protein
MKCRDCGNSTKEFLVLPTRKKQILFLKWENAPSIYLCREHLLQRFRDEFTGARQKMVVFYPNLEEKNGNCCYSFMRLKDFNKYASEEQTYDHIVRNIQQWLDMVEGKCLRCSHAGQVAYFGREAVEWKQVPGYPGASSDYPMLPDVTARPEILCASCAFQNIERSFRAPVRGFEDGVFCPDSVEEGVYLTVEV